MRTCTPSTAASVTADPAEELPCEMAFPEPECSASMVRDPQGPPPPADATHVADPQMPLGKYSLDFVPFAAPAQIAGEAVAHVSGESRDSGEGFDGAHPAVDLGKEQAISAEPAAIPGSRPGGGARRGARLAAGQLREGAVLDQQIRSMMLVLIDELRPGSKFSSPLGTPHMRFHARMQAMARIMPEYGRN